MEKEYGGVSVQLNEEGFMTDAGQWSKEVGSGIAEELGIDMTEKHWQVVEYLRQQHAANVEMSIRKVGKSGLATIKEFYQMFPGGPLKNASRIAGLARPTSCV